MAGTFSCPYDPDYPPLMYRLFDDMMQRLGLLSPQIVVAEEDDFPDFQAREEKDNKAAAVVAPKANPSELLEKMRRRTNEFAPRKEAVLPAKCVGRKIFVVHMKRRVVGMGRFHSR